MRCFGHARDEGSVTFAEELNQLLPDDLPHRDVVVEKASKHLALIEEANQHFNLTRITGPREAAIKHVLDSVLPWRLFAESARVLDAGTGAGFPGIPLSLALPETRFTLSESIQKKARFVQSAVEQLGLANVEATSRRAEEIAPEFAIVTARAVAPISRAIGLFAPAVKAGARLLMYKGPDVEQEIAEAAGEMKRRRVQANVLLRYDLPDALGTRTIVELIAVRS
jgi:16S rRNA (guanine527-N7)-methyltransferase